ncbi:MAG TPA: GrpB family protein, partial [Blastocatellia bacterium]
RVQTSAPIHSIRTKKSSRQDLHPPLYPVGEGRGPRAHLSWAAASAATNAILFAFMPDRSDIGSPDDGSDTQPREPAGPELAAASGILVVDYDPQWPALFRIHDERIISALGDRALQVEHMGSTSVPGLAAKPVIDVLVAVKDSADEGSYAPALISAGYELRIREPEWYEHRMFKGSSPEANVHVFSIGCEEIDRVLTFRDRLRTNASDRDLYARTKLELVRHKWKYVQEYADAKSQVVAEIMAHASLNQP